jgi:hypothetical protein
MFGAGCPLIDDGFLRYFRQGALYLIIACIGSTPYPKQIAEKIASNKFVSAVGVVVLLALWQAFSKRRLQG